MASTRRGKWGEKDVNGDTYRLHFWALLRKSRQLYDTNKLYKLQLSLVEHGVITKLIQDKHRLIGATGIL